MARMCQLMTVRDHSQIKPCAQIDTMNVNRHLRDLSGNIRERIKLRPKPIYYGSVVCFHLFHVCTVYANRSACRSYLWGQILWLTLHPKLGKKNYYACIIYQLLYLCMHILPMCTKSD